MKAGLGPRGFPKSVRLLRRSEFRRVYEEGQRRSVPLCVAFLRPNGLNESRLGITTTGRLGGAVVRNRVRRRLREVFRLNRASIREGWDIVLNPRTSVAQIPFETLTREILRLFPSQPPPSATAVPGPDDRVPPGGGRSR